MAASTREEVDQACSLSSSPQGFHSPHPLGGTRHTHFLGWRTHNRSFGKAAAHRGRTSSWPLDLCPSHVVSVTHVMRHYSWDTHWRRRAPVPWRHHVHLATVSPPPPAPALPARLLRRRIRSAQAHIPGPGF